MVGCGCKTWHAIENREVICSHDHLCVDCCNRLNGVSKQETTEIKKPTRDNLYWAKYWLDMKTRTGCNNFDEQARTMRNKIFGITWMTGQKTKEDEEIVKILDAILGAAE